MDDWFDIDVDGFDGSIGLQFDDNKDTGGEVLTHSVDDDKKSGMPSLERGSLRIGPGGYSIERVERERFDVDKKDLDQYYFRDNIAYNKFSALLTRNAQGVLGLPVKVFDPGVNSPAIAYTMDKKEGRFVPIAISRFNSFYEKATKEEGITLRTGLLCHEVLHQVMTPFAVVERRAKQMDKSMANVFHYVHNILEDPAIENFAPEFVPTRMANALKFTIKWSYDSSPPLDVAKTAWEQYTMALIQYGDMGPLIGDFTFPEAKDMFMKTVDLFTEGINNPKGFDRVMIASKLTEITKPLWERDPEPVKQDFKGDSPLLASPVQPKGPRDPKGSGGSGGYGEYGGNSGGLGSEGDPDIDSLSESAKAKLREDIKNKLKASMSQDGKDRDFEEDQDQTLSDNLRDDTKGMPNYDVPTTGKAEEQVDANGEYKRMSGKNEGPSSMDKLLQEVISEIDAESLLDVAESLEKSIEQQKKISSHANNRSEVLITYDRSILSKYHCDNRIAADGDPSAYAELVRDVAPEIGSLTRQLKKIFRVDEDDDLVMSKSGEYNLERHIRTLGNSAYLFDKRREPGDKRDMCIALCVDHSGSMSGGRLNDATRASVLLAETCARLNIPCYIMGYNYMGTGNQQIHYVQWKNRKSERTRLSNMPYSSDGSNMDCYNIKYMTEEVINPYKAAHKIMFIISDGQPSTGFGNDYVQDAASVVADARKSMDVIGIGIGNSRDAFERMYGDGYVNGSDTKQLPKLIAGQLKRLVKKW